MRASIAYLALILLILAAPLALAHETDEDHPHDENDYTTLDETLKTGGLWAVIVGSAWVAIITFLALWCPPHSAHRHKKLLFLLLVIPIALVTIYLAATTVYLNTYSHTGGPVHWHADFELWHCGTRLDLIDPTGLMNRVGTPVYHEHNDDRIHVEGVVWQQKDVHLSRFFSVIGGFLAQDLWRVPTDSGIVEARTGDLCPDGTPGELQVFAWQTQDGKAVQRKLDEFTTYVMSPNPLVPPGDCLIIEFGPRKDRTDRICTTYRIALEKGALLPDGDA